MSDLPLALRTSQEAHPTLGLLFRSLYTFAERTIDRFFDDCPIPVPTLAMEKDRTGRRGFYTEMDGYGSAHRINLNPFELRSGVEAAEVLAHELVHEWQAIIGEPCQRNYHGVKFHERMLRYGIVTEGNRGRTVAFSDGTWQRWLLENDDLNLDKFILPGADKPREKRKMMKFGCGCGYTFRNRKVPNVQCLDCGETFRRVATREEKDDDG